MDSLDAFSGSYTEKLVKLSKEKRVPISGAFELLPICNMRCKMCYIQHEPKLDQLQPVDFWADLFEQATGEGLLFPLITGGEPFLYPDFEELYSKVIRMPVQLGINTNATLLTREKVKWLAKQPPKRLNISLYGASDETYARLCGNPNGFSQVMRALDLLKEYQIDFRIHSTIVPDNISDYQQIIDICDRYRTQLAMTYYMFPAYRKEKESVAAEGRFTTTQMAEVAMQYSRSIAKAQGDVSNRALLLKCMAMEHPQIYSLYNQNDVSCNAGRCTFWVSWRGELSGCGVHNQGAIALKETSFKEAWKRVTAYTDTIMISEKCKTCRYRCICPTCAAACFCETGSLTGTPEYLCAFSEKYAALLQKERKRLFADK